MRPMAAALALFLAPCALGAQAAPRDTVVATKPTLLAFFLVDPAAIDSEPSGDLATIADDFAYYVGVISPLLDSLGVAVDWTSEAEVTVLTPGAPATTLPLAGPDGARMGFWLLGGGREPRFLGGGVHTDVDLVPAVCRHFGLPLPPAYQEAATVPTAESRGPEGVSEASALTIGETFTIESKALGETRRINIYVPPAWGESAGARRPVLYMPDGGLSEDFLHVAGLMQVSTGNGTMRPFILVGIENTERRRDLTGPTDDAEDRKIAPRVGGSAAFRAFLRAELMPAVDARFRTTGETAIVGESLAGLFVVETFFLEPALFDTYIAFDPSLWWNDDDLVKQAGARLRAGGTGGRTLYLASSREEELSRPARRLAELLRANAPPTLRWYYEPLPGETHATLYHPAALLAFRRLFKPGPD